MYSGTKLGILCGMAMPSPFLLSVLSQITVIVMNLCSPAFMGPRKHPYPAYIPGNLSQDITGKLSWDWTTWEAGQRE